jgi:hypothetical protein
MSNQTKKPGALENLAALLRSKQESEALLQTARLANDELLVTQAKLTADLTTALARITELEASVSMRDAERETLLTTIRSLETQQSSVAAETLEQLAALGFAPSLLPIVAADALPGAGTPAELRREFQTIVDPTARAAFYATHSAQMLS